MPWTYSQSTGHLQDPLGRDIGSGYSGHGGAANDPSKQAMRSIGPIPRGNYTIGPAHHDQHRGPDTMRLTPDTNTQTFGRAGFLIHADNRHHNHTASEGCIILSPVLRHRIANSTDRALIVAP